MMWSALSARAKASAMTWSAVSGRAKDAAMQLLLHNTCKAPNQHTVDGQVGICMDRGRKEGINIHISLLTLRIHGYKDYFSWAVLTHASHSGSREAEVDGPLSEAVT